MRASRVIRVGLIVGTLLAVSFPNAANGGPLLDWLRGRRPCATPQPSMACGLQPGQCQTTCMQTCSRVVVNYVPHTAYRTTWEQVPVTQYRPVTNTDPCTGCTVTCMKPCTTYSWQQKQVPYTTYRPVYRTENYSVPVTYVTPASQAAPCVGCAVPAANNGCTSCGVPGSSPVYYDPNAPAVGASVLTPNGTLSTNGSYSVMPSGSYNPAPYMSSPTPADLPPTLNSVNPQSMQRPVLEQLHGHPGAAYPTAPKLQTPVNQPYLPPARSVPSFDNLTVDATPTHQRWGYTPVRLASYTSTAVPQPEIETVQPTREFLARPLGPANNTEAAPVNAGWTNVGW
ncbi:MAG TPA: hypothetical protein PKD54_03295 [Pirellulaceae bacterium]|nr:hypothetical protein [Pirellulaceae bacterium]